MRMIDFKRQIFISPLGIARIINFYLNTFSYMCVCVCMCVYEVTCIIMKVNKKQQTPTTKTKSNIACADNEKNNINIHTVKNCKFLFKFKKFKFLSP